MCPCFSLFDYSKSRSQAMSICGSPYHCVVVKLLTVTLSFPRHIDSSRFPSFHVQLNIHRGTTPTFSLRGHVLLQLLRIYDSVAQFHNACSCLLRISSDILVSVPPGLSSKGLTIVRLEPFSLKRRDSAPSMDAEFEGQCRMGRSIRMAMVDCADLELMRAKGRVVVHSLASILLSEEGTIMVRLLGSGGAAE